MKKYANVINGVIDNIVIFENEPVFSAAQGSYVCIDKLIPEPGRGWLYKSGVFTKPVIIEPAPVITPESKAKEIVKTIVLTELDKTDVGKALKAFLVLNNLVDDTK